MTIEDTSRRRTLALATIFATIAATPAWSAPAGRAARRPQPSLTAVQALVAADQLPDALRLCERLLATGRGGRDAHVLRAELLAWTGATGPAIDAYDGLLATHPSDHRVQLGRALALKWHGDLLAADRELSRLAGDPEADKHLAELRASPEFAVAQARSLYEAAPEEPDAAIAYAAALRAQQRTWDAVDVLERANAARPGHPRLTDALDAARTAMHDAAVARIAERAPALADAPDGDERRIAQAEDLAAAKRLGDAAREYARYVRAHPERRDLRRQEARIRSWNKDLGRAMSAYDALIADTPDDHGLQVEAARALSWDGRLAATARRLAPLRTRDDTRADAAVILADVWRWDGARARPAALYQEALDAGVSGDPALAARRYLEREGRYSLLAPRFRWFRDSDDFTAVRAGVGFTQQWSFATRAEIEVHHVDYEQRERHLGAERLSLHLVHEWNALRFTAAVGAVVYDTGTSLPTAMLAAEWLPLPEHRLGVGFEHTDLIDGVTNLRASRPVAGDPGPRVLQADRGRVWGRAVLPFDVHADVEASLGQVDDGNRTHAAGLLLTRRLVRLPRLTLGADVRTSGTAERSPRYWSPRRYWSTGVRVVIEQPLWWGVTARVEGRGGYAEEDGASSIEMSYGGELTTDPDRPLALALVYHGGETAREGGYGSHTIFVEVTWRFGGVP